MNIAIICASPTPIPATRGGATETMMTHLLEVNEEFMEHHFSVFSYFEKQASLESKRFRHSTFYFYQPNINFEKYEGLYWRFLRKISNERIYLRSSFVKWCADIIDKSSFDIVILEGNCFHVEHMRSLLKEQKLILHMHIDRLNVELKAARRMIDACNGIFTISEFCKRRVLDVNPNVDDKVVVVKNTIDTGKFVYKGESVRNKMRQKFSVSREQKIVSYCGRLHSSKGVLELVRSLLLLNDSNIHLLIIGSSIYLGSQKTPFISQLENECKKLPGGVTFTGYIPQSSLPDYLSASDIAVVPSVCLEAAGNVTIEALSCGIPVVASNQGGIPEYADPKACLNVNYDDLYIENLAKCIKELAYNQTIYKSLKSEARNVAIQYDKHRYYINFISGIKHIINI